MRNLPVALLSFALLVSAPASILAADPPAPQAWIDPVSATAEKLPLASSSLLLDIVRNDERWIVVGERGAILHSLDGATWTQADVPTRSTLTAISLVGSRAWAVGHDGVILRSDDAGNSWQVQRRDPLDTSIPSAQRDPRQGAPLLDVLFLDADHGYAVGSYNLMLSTQDGGANWSVVSLQTAALATKPVESAAAESAPSIDAPENAGSTDNRFAFNEEELELGGESDPHLNGIARTGSGGLFVVSERGSAYRSRDGGTNWQRLQLPYDGSMFGVIGYTGEHVLVYGLRGNVFESTDLGDNWTKVETGTEFSLIGGTALGDGGAALVGANGTVLVRRTAADAFKGQTDLAAGALASALAAKDGQLLVVGENGVKPVVIP